MENTHTSKQKYTIEEVNDIFTESQGEIYDHINDFGLSSEQISHMMELDPKHRPLAAKNRLLKLMTENMIIQQEEREKERKRKNEEDTVVIQEHMIAHEIYYVSGSNAPFFQFRKAGDIDQDYDREWHQMDEREFRDHFNRRHYIQEGIEIEPLLKKQSMEKIANACGRSNDRVKSSMKKQDEFTLNMLEVERKYWITNSDEYYMANDEPSDLIITLLNSIAGGKQENFDHICRCILWKIKGKGESTQLPALVMFGSQGAGKTTFTEVLLPTMTHGKKSLAKLDVKDLNGFNSTLEGAAFVLFNESERDQRAISAIKDTIGGPTVRIEKKGIDSYVVDNTAWYMFATNDPMSSIHLSQDASENRRFSLIKSEQSLNDVVRKKYGVSRDKAQLMCQEIANACADRKEVARTFKWIEKTYDSTTQNCPIALHGKDYMEAIGTQRTERQEILETIFAACIQAGKNVRRRDVINLLREKLTTQKEKNMSEEAFKRMISNFILTENKKRPEDNKIWWNDSNSRKMVRGISYREDVIVLDKDFQKTIKLVELSNAYLFYTTELEDQDDKVNGKTKQIGDPANDANYFSGSVDDIELDDLLN